MDLIDGVAKGQLRLGIAMGRFTAYVELSEGHEGSQRPFQYSITSGGQRLYAKFADTFDAARQQAEADLRALCAGYTVTPRPRLRRVRQCGNRFAPWRASRTDVASWYRVMGTRSRPSLNWQTPSVGAVAHVRNAEVDGEIVCLDANGCPQFNDLCFDAARRSSTRLRSSSLRLAGQAIRHAH